LDIVAVGITEGHLQLLEIDGLVAKFQIYYK